MKIKLFISTALMIFNATQIKPINNQYDNLQTEHVYGIVIDDKTKAGIDSNGEYISYYNIDCDLYDEILTFFVIDSISDDVVIRHDVVLNHEDVFVDVFQDGTLITYENEKSYYIDNDTYNMYVEY